MKYGTKIALWGIVGVVVVAAGIWGFRDGAEDASNTETATSTQQAGTSDKKMAFSQLAQQGGAYKCSVTQTTKEVASNGVVYIDKGLIRGDFDVVYGGGTKMQTSFIMRDGYTYTWTSAAPTVGMKIKNTAPTQASASATVNTPNGEILDQIGDYECVEWKAEASKFALPTTITFTAIN